MKGWPRYVNSFFFSNFKNAEQNHTWMHLDAQETAINLSRACYQSAKGDRVLFARLVSDYSAAFFVKKTSLLYLLCLQ